jgi:hypothetical protein
MSPLTAESFLACRSDLRVEAEVLTADSAAQAVSFAGVAVLAGAEVLAGVDVLAGVVLGGGEALPELGPALLEHPASTNAMRAASASLGRAFVAIATSSTSTRPIMSQAATDGIIRGR